VWLPPQYNEPNRNSNQLNKTIDMERTYKTIKWVLKGHIKNNVNSLWIWEDDNFTCIFDTYSGNERIYTSSQLLRLLS
jgi:hypothetical protein